MPTYEYKCTNCGHGFEIVQSMNHRKKRKCPSCNQLKLEKVFGTPMVFVKGEPQTVGHWADRNTQKMGHYELGDREGKRKENLKKDKPILGSGPATQKEIKKMTPAQKKKYIEEGKK